MVYTTGALPIIIITPLVGISVSYTFNFAAVLRVPPTRGKQRAFSTGGSHLSVGVLIGVYFSPVFSHTAQKDTAAAVMYTVVTPRLNPSSAANATAT
ncbi:hypothetical protein QTO34_015336 [Cnephaeus nilssonii]|uniref:Uncharacterized protein n=1 Tax=Cnephaeus nilssonii TaxID=3371016 RepID=A0AA40LR47_CNENI|nr:hypothetical protein QTO34_015336 [Eptesicus nilssonii]